MDLETATRLGEGLVDTGVISPHAMQKSVDVIDGYLSLCRDEGVEEIVAIGTSTLREASNRSHFLETVRRRCGVEIEIISGQEEARLAHLAVARDRQWPPGPLVVIDIGGGSTEWIHGETGGEVRVFTMCIGSVRLTEQFIASDPVNEDEYLAMVSHVRRLLEALPPLAAHALLVGIGGTIATLFSVKEGLREFQPSRIHHGLLELKDIEEQIQQFKSLPLRQRRAIAGLPPRKGRRHHGRSHHTLVFPAAIGIESNMGQLPWSQVWAAP